MPIAKKKTGVTTPPTNKGASSGDSFMQRLKGTKPAEKKAFYPLPPGQYEALAYKAEFARWEDSQKEAVWIEFVVVNDGALDGKTSRMYYNLVDAEGNASQGEEYMVRDFQILGFDYTQFNSQTEFEEGLSEFFETEAPWVVIDVKKNGKNTNIYLNSIMDDQENKPDSPL